MRMIVDPFDYASHPSSFEILFITNGWLLWFEWGKNGVLNFYR